MALREKALSNGWSVVTNDQRPAMHVVGSGKELAAGFFAEKAEDLARAYKLTSAHIPETGHFVADIGDWLIRSSATQGDEVTFSFPGRDVSYIQQERVLHVPYTMDASYRFEVARYELDDGRNGYFIYGYQVALHGGKREDEPWLMAHRVERGIQDNVWMNTTVNTDSNPGSEFVWVARLSGKRLEHYVVTVQQGGDISPHPDDGLQMRLAA